MIIDPGIFDDSYLPRRLLHRDAEVQQLSRQIQPLVFDAPAHHTMISGPSGVGKTVLARHTLDRLSRASNDVRFEHLRCLGMTVPDMIAALLEAAPGGPREVDRDQFTTVGELRRRLDGLLEEPMIAILDEADGLSHTSAVEHLAGVQNLSLICICHDPDDWLSRIDRDHRSEFDGENHIRLDRYGTGELLDILWIRAKQGLPTGAISRDQLRYIADEVAGVARYGIQTIYDAAQIATDRGHDAIQGQDIDDAFPRARRRIRKAALLSMPFHHQLLYSLIANAGEISSGTLYDRYDDIADSCYRDRVLEPIGRRARRNKLDKLGEYGLVESDGENYPIWRPVDASIQPPIDLQSLTNISGAYPDGVG